MSQQRTIPLEHLTWLITVAAAFGWYVIQTRTGPVNMPSHRCFLQVVVAQTHDEGPLMASSQPHELGGIFRIEILGDPFTGNTGTIPASTNIMLRC
jgi:hypothetical protein